MPVKGKRKLAYSRRTHDTRQYGLYIYEAAITPIVKALFREQLEEARKRVTITRAGRYIYNPSKEYINFLKRFHKHVKINEHG